MLTKEIIEQTYQEIAPDLLATTEDGEVHVDDAADMICSRFPPSEWEDLPPNFIQDILANWEGIKS
jgi:hypothetical protein